MKYVATIAAFIIIAGTSQAVNLNWNGSTLSTQSFTTQLTGGGQVTGQGIDVPIQFATRVPADATGILSITTLANSSYLVDLSIPNGGNLIDFFAFRDQTKVRGGNLSVPPR